MISFRRFKEWLSVAFGANVGLRDWVSILKGALSILRSGVDHAEWARRTRVCYACPMFNEGRKQCRPFPESELGCGCYVPYSNLIGTECWGRTVYGSHVGWGK